MVQNSLDSGTFAKLKSKIFKSKDEVREFIPMTHDNFFQNCFQTLHHTGKTFVHLYKLLSMGVRSENRAFNFYRY